MATGTVSPAFADRQLVRAARLVCGSPSEAVDLKRFADGEAAAAFRERAKEHCFAGLLYRVLSRPEVPASDELRSMVRDHYQRQLAHNHYVIGELRALLAELDGLDVLVIKGLALAALLYGDAGARPTADIDLAVRLEDATEAAGRLERLGYVPKADFGEKLRLYCHGTLEREGAAGVPVEMHWSIGRNFPAKPLDELLWLDPAEIDIFGFRARTLASENQLLLACLHLVHHSVFGWQPSLLWLTDVALLISRGCDWDRFLRITLEQRCGRAAYVACVLSERLLGVAAPQEVTASLKMRSGSVGRLAARGALDRLPISGVPAPARHLVASAFQGRLSKRGRYLGKHLIKPTLVRMGIWRRGRNRAGEDE